VFEKSVARRLLEEVEEFESAVCQQKARPYCDRGEGNS